MKNNKLFHLLASLSKPEAKRFAKYVSYPLFNKQQNVTDLVVFLPPQLKKHEKETYQELRQKAFEKIYPNEAYNATKMKRLLSATYSLLSDFLAQEELREERKNREALLRKSFHRRRLDGLYLASLAKEEKELEKSTVVDFYFHQARMQLRHEAYFNVGLNGYSGYDPVKSLISLQEDLDTGYLMAKLHYACQVKVIQLFRGERKTLVFLDETLKMAKSPIYEKHQLIQLYLLLFSLLEETSKEGYLLFKTELLASMPLLNKELQAHLLVLLINLTWLVIERNQVPRAILELYDYGLQNNIITQNGRIDASHFNNIVDIGSNLGEFDYIRQFVDDYLPYLDVGEDSIGNVKILFESFLYFGEEKYEKVILHLNYLKFEDLSYGLRAYSMLIKSFYETKKEKGFKEIDAHCEAFRQYIKRKYKQGYLSNLVREENLNFIKIASQLPHTSKSVFAPINTEKLKGKLLSMQRVVSKSWLIQKIDDL